MRLTAFAIIAFATALGTSARAQSRTPAQGNCVFSGGINNGLIVQNCDVGPKHPNGIHQNSFEVGRITGLRLIDQNTAYADRVSGGPDFDPESDFEFQGYNFHIIKFGISSSNSDSGELQHSALGMVTLKIVRPIQPPAP